MRLLYETIYLMLLVIVILDFVIAWFMNLFNWGEAKILSPIMGTAVGYLIFWITPTSMAGVIVGAIFTIISNLVLTHVVYPKLGDKLDKHVEKTTRTHNDNEFNRILFSPDTEERVKYLYRHMQFKKFYCFSFSADLGIVFKNVKEAIDNSDLLSNYPGVKIKAYDDSSEKENPQRYLIFSIEGVQIVFISARSLEQKDVYVLGIHQYNDDHLKLKERIALENKIGHLLDRIYVLSSHAIRNLDDDSKVEIIPFNLT